MGRTKAAGNSQTALSPSTHPPPPVQCYVNLNRPRGSRVEERIYPLPLAGAEVDAAALAGVRRVSADAAPRPLLPGAISHWYRCCAGKPCVHMEAQQQVSQPPG
jgi:hypothetical protein